MDNKTVRIVSGKFAGQTGYTGYEQSAGTTIRVTLNEGGEQMYFDFIELEVTGDIGQESPAVAAPTTEEDAAVESEDV